MNKQDLLVILDALRKLRGDQAWELARGKDGNKIVPDLQDRLIAQLAALPDDDAQRLAALHRKWACTKA